MNAARLSVPLSEAGVDCTYASLSDTNEYARFLHPSAKLVPLLTGSTGSSTLRTLKAVPKLASLLKDGQFDAVVPVLEGPALTVAVARKLASRPVLAIVSVQNAYLRLFENSKGASARIRGAMSKFAYGSCDGAIALSQGVGADLARLVPSLAGSVRVVNNIGLDRTVPNKVGVRTGGRTKLVACGRLLPVKDYPTMLRAFASLPERLDATLDILGDGEQRDELQSLIEKLGVADRVNLRGFLPDPAAAMAESDIFILTSLTEGFGNVIVEAMAVGLPVIATDCPYGPREILDDGKYGVLVPVGDAKAIAAAIESLAGDGEARECFASAGIARANDFLPSVIGQQFLASLEDLAQNRAH